jgi:hypothetical protein
MIKNTTAIGVQRSRLRKTGGSKAIRKKSCLLPAWSLPVSCLKLEIWPFPSYVECEPRIPNSSKMFMRWLLGSLIRASILFRWNLSSFYRNRNGSVGTQPGYELEGRSSIHGNDKKFFSSLKCPTGPGAQLASYPLSIKDSSPRGTVACVCHIHLTSIRHRGQEWWR